jgi:YtkA-like protein
VVRIIIAICFALVACGSDPASRPSEHQTMITDHGLLHLDVLPTPDPPIRGDDVVEVAVTDANGAPVDGLTLDAQPWMPSHGHGTSVVPTVTPEGGGRYRIDHVYLYMAGTWELRLSFSGTESDTATPAFDIP